MSSTWFLAHWPDGADRWSVEFYCASEAELMAQVADWLMARPSSAKGCYFFGDFDVSREKHAKELRRVAHKRAPDFAVSLEAFGRRTMNVGAPAWGDAAGLGLLPPVLH